MRIKIIRHSERLDHKNYIYWMFCIGQYWADSPLTPNGYIMAKEAGDKMKEDNFNPKFIYTSPYNRTIATSTEIKKVFSNAEIIIEPLLSEYQPYYAHTISLYPQGIPTLFNGTITNFSYPEKLEELSNRVKFIIMKLIENHDCDLIIVTHGEIIKEYVRYLQLLFPDLMLNSGKTPYLTTISFDFDKSQNKIIKSSINVNYN